MTAHLIENQYKEAIEKKLQDSKKTRDLNVTIENHGLQVLEYNVLVIPDVVIEFEETKSGLILAKDSIETKKDQAKQEKATIIEVAEKTFEGWALKPKRGDRVLMAQYAGKNIIGKDGELYRLIKDDEIDAIIHF
jgi:co-chaperonin GroES (HSP10)